jgi:hypothetical protein
LAKPWPKCTNILDSKDYPEYTLFSIYKHFQANRGMPKDAAMAEQRVFLVRTRIDDRRGAPSRIASVGPRASIAAIAGLFHLRGDGISFPAASGRHCHENHSTFVQNERTRAVLFVHGPTFK